MRTEPSCPVRKPIPTGESPVAPSPDSASAQGPSDFNYHDDDDTPSSPTLSTHSASEDGKLPGHSSESSPEKSSDLVGKINNLVSTDMENIAQARYFVMLLACPVQGGLCVIFLWEVLGWR
jgi:hypothetical protein